MTGLELSTFDQTGILFLVFSAFGLIHERRVLPFLMVLAGAAFQGPLAAVLVAILLVWHRLDRAAPRWIQAKDMLGILFVIGSVFSADVLQSFLAFFGVFLISVNLGGGLLGPLPALLLLRQYHPHPEHLEIVLGGTLIYWLGVEVFRFTRLGREKETLSYLEALTSLAVLVGFQPEIERILADSLFLGIAGALVALELGLFFWIRFRRSGFLHVYEGLRSVLGSALGAGNHWIRSSEPWSGVPEEIPEIRFDRALEQIFHVVLILVVSIAAFLVAVRGGIG